MNVEVEGRTFEMDDDNRLHSVRSELHGPSRGPTASQTSGKLIAGYLADYGQEVAALLEIGDELEKRHKNVAKLEKALQSNHMSPPRQSFSPHLRAALNVLRGEGTWEQ